MSRARRALGRSGGRKLPVDWAEKCEILLSQCHPKQRALAESTHRRLAGIVGRRGGKTTAVRVRFFRRLQRPASRCLYIAATRESAAELLWYPIKEIFERTGFDVAGGDIRFNETKLKLTVLANRSQLQLVGADNRRDIEKLRGQHFDEIWIDEGGVHPPQLLRNLITKILGPALGDTKGTLGIIGTPSHVLAGPFYEVTGPGAEANLSLPPSEAPPDYNGWHVHRWTLQDGVDAGIPAMINAMAVALEDKEREGWSDDHPTWKREWLGLWAADDTENVYKYRPHLDDGTRWNQWDPEIDPRTGFAVLPKPHGGGEQWSYVYGLDFGSKDPTAIQVFAFNAYDKTLWHVYEFGQRGMYPETIAKVLIGKELNHDKPGGLFGVTGWPTRIVADVASLGGAFLDELANVYGVVIEPADKKFKHDSIELFNGDLIEGRLKIMKDSLLETQLLHQQWAIDDYGGLREDKSGRNDATDAAIYARRAARHLFTEERSAPRPTPGSREALDLWAQESLDNLLKPREDDGANYLTEFDFEY